MYQSDSTCWPRVLACLLRGQLHSTGPRGKNGTKIFTHYTAEQNRTHQDKIHHFRIIYSPVTDSLRNDNMALSAEGKISVLSFLTGCSISAAYLTLELFHPLSILWRSIHTVIILLLIATNAILLTLLYRTRSDLYQVRMGAYMP